MLAIVGAGPGSPELLTRQAWDALDAAEHIFFEPQTRDLVGSRIQWMDIASLANGETIREQGKYFADRNLAWLVPGTPALYPPVREFMAHLDPAWLQYIDVLSGVPPWSHKLDSEGIFLGDHVVTIQSAQGEELLQCDGVQVTESDLVQRIPWRAARSLAGRKIALLRQGRRIERAARWLTNAGAEVMLHPVSRIKDPTQYDVIDAAMAHLERYDWVIFTSGEAVERWFGRMKNFGLDIRRVRGKIAVVGPETAMRVRDWGLVAELMPDKEFSQEGLLDAFSYMPIRGNMILFPGGQLNGSMLSEALRERGALVEEVLLYENVKEPLALTLHQAIRTESLDAILYTASSQVEYLVEQLSVEDRQHLGHIASFSIGPLTTRTLNHYGISVAVEPLQPSLRLLVEAVKQYFIAEDDHVSD